MVLTYNIKIYSMDTNSKEEEPAMFILRFTIMLLWIIYNAVLFVASSSSHIFIVFFKLYLFSFEQYLHSSCFYLTAKQSKSISLYFIKKPIKYIQ